jgi:hypothetical protein
MRLAHHACCNCPWLPQRETGGAGTSTAGAGGGDTSSISVDNSRLAHNRNAPAAIASKNKAARPKRVSVRARGIERRCIGRRVTGRQLHANWQCRQVPRKAARLPCRRPVLGDGSPSTLKELRPTWRRSRPGAAPLLSEPRGNELPTAF